MDRPREGGFAMMTLLALMVPALLTVGALTLTMTGRTALLRTQFDRERALLAAESGVDDAIFRGRTASLVDGARYTRDLGRGLSFDVAATYLKTDNVDNDDDGQLDEDDEDVFQVVVTGRYRNTARRLAAYLGPIALLPPITSAMAVSNRAVSIDVGGTALITGNDTNLDGTPGSTSLPGLTITPPGTVADLLDELNGAEQSRVQGAGGAPSLGTSPEFDLATVVAQVQNYANLVLTSDRYANYTFGTPTEGRIAYREGDLRLAGNCYGSGVLVVTGNLQLTGNFRFDGVIIVLGDVENNSGTMDTYGGILQGSRANRIELRGTANVRYSRQAVTLANAASGLYVAFNGWQELSR